MLPESNGIVHWSISSLTNNPNLMNAILKGPYARQALVPASRWLDNKAPAAPVITSAWRDDTLTINWTHPDERDVFHWIVFTKYNNKWGYQILNRNARSVKIERVLPGTPASGSITLQQFAVTAVDRTGNESELREMDVKK